MTHKAGDRSATGPGRGQPGAATVRIPPPARATQPAIGGVSPCLPGTEWAAAAGYELLGELGRGSMGVVYKARQVALDRLVALKTLQDSPLGRQEGLDRFISEARVIARLQHPNIVQVYEISLQRDLPFFAMELVEGGNLAAALAGKPQPFRDSARLTATLARAMHAAHEQGVVHRDLKPANVLLSRRASCQLAPEKEQASSLLYDPVPKITDFGLAKQLDGDSSLTQSGVILGTPNYMAPEQARGRSRDVGPQADVYALGAILYEMLTGRPPHNAESPAETMLSLFQIEPVVPSRLRPKLPRDLETICLKCLQKDPAHRYPTAAELAADLDRYLEGVSIQARRAPVRERFWKWVKRRPASAALAGSAVGMLLTFLGLIVFHQARLRDKLIEARQEEQLAHDAKEQIRLRAGVKELLQRAEASIAREDWQAALLHLGHAQGQLADEEALSDLRESWQQLSDRATRQRRDREKLARFRAAREQALFEATLFTGSDLKEALKRTRRCAHAALAVFGLAEGKPIQPILDSPYFTASERDEITAGCYELLLVEAEAIATALPGHSAENQSRRARSALALLDRAEALGMVTRALRQRRAAYLALAGDSGASEAARIARATTPRGVLDHFLLGDELLRKGDAAAAISAFEQALQQQPEHFWAQCYLALAWMKRQRPDLAAQAFTACLGKRPDFAWLNLLRGAARGELGQYEGAEADFAIAFTREASEPARYALLNHRGVLRVRQGRADEATHDLQEAVRMRPNQYQGHINLSQAHLRAGRLDDAIASLDRAVALESGLASLYRTRARVQMLRQRDADALADLNTALRCEPNAPAGSRSADHLVRARLLLRGRDHAAALEACNLALALVRDARGFRLRAEAMLGLGRHADALAALDACLESQPRDAEVLCARASLRTRLGQYAGAQSDYGRALEIAPDADTHAARGWTYLLTDTPRLALEDFAQALKREGTKADALVGRGLARMQLGEVRQAVADARQALRVGPASSRLSYNVARVFSQASARTERRPGSRERDTLIREAVESLADSLGQLPLKDRAEFWHARVVADPALQPIRNSPGFLRLADRYPVQTATR